MNKKITIKSISQQDKTVKASININGHEEIVTTLFNENCAPYISLKSIDPYVIGFLYFAMNYGYDIESKLPISEELYYNLHFHFIDSLIQANPNFHRVQINAPLTQANDISFNNKNIVATGISCGVDSLYTIATHGKQSSILSDYKLNALCFFNVGAAMKGNYEPSALIEGRKKLAQTFAEEYGYKFLYVESNIHFIINKYAPYSHVENHTYMALFCCLHLQNGIAKYYYSSGYTIKDFSIIKEGNKELDAAHYDLLTLSIASINGCKFYSIGSTTTRLNKVSYLCNYPPAYKYLNVCVNEVQNDNKCFKCIRTILEIDAVGDITKFNKVFDINEYQSNFNWYLRRLYIDCKLKKDPLLQEVYPYFKYKISLTFKLKTIFSIIINKLLRKNG